MDFFSKNKQPQCWQKTLVTQCSPPVQFLPCLAISVPDFNKAKKISFGELYHLGNIRTQGSVFTELKKSVTAIAKFIPAPVWFIMLQEGN